MPLLTFRKKGIYCEQADVYIDPWRPVSKALITHGHSDHARRGMKSYLCSSDSVPILKHRLGKNIPVTGIDYGKTTLINGVKISFHPAGHVLGSAQIRLEHQGEIWVVTGDYKTVDDGISTAFESVKCHHFITETTFGLPFYQWKQQREIYDNMNQWWLENIRDERPSIIQAYSLGKAQRVISAFENHGPIYVHPTIAAHNQAYEERGINLGDYRIFNPENQETDYSKCLIITPGSSVDPKKNNTLENASLASASGWMQMRKARRQRNVERGFVLSDHADWPGLNKAIKETGAENIYVTHGYTKVMKKWLIEKGYNAKIVETEFGEEEV